MTHNTKTILEVSDRTVVIYLFFSAMAAILRDRINDLLTANADLEREVARLRYADAGDFFSSCLKLYIQTYINIYNIYVKFLYTYIHILCI